MTLIENWRKAYQFWSVQFAALAAVLLGIKQMGMNLWAALPTSLQAVVPQWAVDALPFIVVILIPLVRVIRQPKVSDAS